MKFVASSESGRFTRRSCVYFFPIVAVLGASEAPKLGDAEWTRRFTKFMKELNEFIILLNDNKVDRKKWEQVKASWDAIESN
jgi:hypothetical protein